MAHTYQLTPAVAILLVHDLLLAKKGISLPPSHGLRVAVERHKARLQAEFTKARIRRKCPTLDALKAAVEAQLGPVHPRWVRVNVIKTTVDDQLATTFRGFEVVPGIDEVIASAGMEKKVLCLDPHVPNLLAVSPGVDLTKTDAYKAGEIILQDKASCFPAYLLDPRTEDGDIIDACSAPGNKTTHLAAVLHPRRGFAAGQKRKQRIFAFEKDPERAKTLEKMVAMAGADRDVVIRGGQDFLKVDPYAPEYAHVGALLLDPSCSGTGIVGRDDAPEFHLPSVPSQGKNAKSNPKKRKHQTTASGFPQPSSSNPNITVADDNGNTTVLSSPAAFKARLASLAAFQLAIIQHAMKFPAATKITYSTCSIHAAENEAVVAAAVSSPIARARGWRVLRREEMVRGMKEWPVRGDKDAYIEEVEGNERGEKRVKQIGTGGKEDIRRLTDEEIEACIRTVRGDGKGTMGFFVACFVRDRDSGDNDDDGPYLRDENGRIIRDENGIPTLKATGQKAVDFEALRRAREEEEDDGEEEPMIISLSNPDDDDGEGPFLRDEHGRIVRGQDGMPVLKQGAGRGNDDGGREDDEDDKDDEEEDEWDGFDD